MPLVPYAPPLIELPISDLQLGDTLVRRKVRFESLLHQQQASGQSFVRIGVRVCPYAALGDGYGEPLTGPGFASYEASLGADNLTLVDATPGEQAGAILAVRTLGQSDEAWQAVVDSFSQPTMLQADFFVYLRENEAIKIADVIRHHIQRADALGRFT
ncbi:hypothetical protein [Hymenobacter cheonanensis]|uniref:hypothetical protein n=1 Tax=Hymenobacter sp. CA2-7 TaxID=3063993 RepID=UPI002713A050|nr:hypothetical protein [Hymenobacter sp. CA2-7]MDO7888240.1 hypothetical protein [Hymenobacter sp. CA2-7]